MTKPQDPGLPGDPSGIDNRKKRCAMQFTLPASIAATTTWRSSGLPEADLTFVLVEATCEIEEMARKFGKGDQIKAAERIQDACTVMIGGKPVGLSHDRLTTWKNAIGVKGRRIVEAKFLENYQVSPEEAAEVDASAKEVFV